MTYVKDRKELEKFVKVKYDIFLDYPRDRTKPPIPALDINDALDVMSEYKNIKYFAVSNIQDRDEVNIICDIIPDNVNFVPKIETIKGVLNLEDIFKSGRVKYIMLDTEDLYTDIKNDDSHIHIIDDVSLYTYLIEKVKRICKENDEVELLELYGVVFS
jgi:citrate lyase beta subunit